MPADPTYEPGKPKSRSAVARRRRPAPKPRPRSNAGVAQAVRAVSGSATRAGRSVSRTATATGAAAAVSGAATRAGRAVPKAARRASRPRSVDPEFAALRAQVERYESGKRSAPRNPGTGLERLRAAGLTGSPNDPLGFLGNFGKDAVDIVTGLPSAAVLAGKTTAYPFIKLAGQEGAEDIEEDIRTAGRAIGSDYSYRWGPLFEGRFGTFGERFKEHPGLGVLDVAGVASAAGAGVRLGAAGAGRATGSARLSRVGSRSTAPGSARYRPPRELTVGMSTEPGAATRAAATTRLARRPYSDKPPTRAVQKVVTKVGDRILSHMKTLREAPDRKGSSLYQRRFNMGTRRQARDIRLAADAEVTRQTSIGARGYVAAVRDLDRAGGPRPGAVKGKWSREQADMAVYLHATDQLRVPGKTARQAADDVAGFMERGLSKNKAAGKRTKEAEVNPQIVRSLPDELLDIKNPVVAKAVGEYRNLVTSATEMRVKAGTLDPTTAIEAPKRHARMVHEGLRYEHKSGLWMNERNPYSPVGLRGVYVKDVPATPIKGGDRGAAGQMGRRMLDKEYQSHGTLFAEGNVRIDRGLPIKSMERAVSDQMHGSVYEDFNKTFAFRNPGNDKIARGRRAVMAFKADPDEVTLVSSKSLLQAERNARDIPEGQMPESPLRKGGPVKMYEGKDGVDELDALGPSRHDDLIAIPSSAIKGMREGWEGIAGGRIKVLDTPTELWKRGILAFAPRYYLNSLFGNATMYGMATGGDLRSVMRVMRNQELRDAVPGRIGMATNVTEAKWSERATKTRSGARYRKVTDRLIGGQAAFDSLFRRALYVRRVGQGLRAEGTKTRGMSPEDFAEAVRTAPKNVVNQAMRETELFLGDYLRLSPAERATLRRIFPFYSWMRVIGRFMLEVPVRHPKRVAIVAMSAQAAQEAINPDDPMQSILANRGRVIAGGLGWRTAGANPVFTHADLIKGAVDQDLKGFLGSAATNLSPIALQQIARSYSGTTAFGAPVSAPPGYRGSASSFGMPTMRLSETTGMPDYYDPTVPVEEQIFQTLPLLPQMLRGLASGDRQPYDVTTTRQLLQGGDPGMLFKPERERGMEPIPYVGPFLGWAGVNAQRYNRAQEIKDAKKRIKDFQEAQRQTAKRKRRVK